MFDKQSKILQKRREENTFRKIKISNGLVDFCSNDYLGYSNFLIGKKGEGLSVGARGSRLLAGNYELIEELEKDSSEFHDAPAGLVFNSGYAANVGFFSCLPQKGDTIIYDELIHASVKDGVRLSFAEGFSFKHNNIGDLKNKIIKAKGEVYVVVESVYSMDGDQAPLKEIVKLNEDLAFVLVVDEAHGVGVFGKKGEGLVHELNLCAKVPIRIVTFGKAIGSHGAIVLCSELVKNYLINYARSFIYSTALPPSSIQVVKMAYKELKTGRHQKDLKQKIAHFKQQLARRKMGGFIPSESAIHCLIVSGAARVRGISDYLVSKGFDVRPILSPTVPQGKERIRICVHTYNSFAEINQLLDSLKDAMGEIK